MKKATAKKISFKKQPRKINPKVWAEIKKGMMPGIHILNDIANKRINLLPMIADRGQLFEMGFPGFMYKLPKPKPLFRETGEQVLSRHPNADRVELLRALGEASVAPMQQFPSRVQFVSVPEELMQPKETPEEAEARREYLKANPPAWFKKMDELIAKKAIESLDKKIADEKAQEDQV
jgi:hypothetical protein